MSNKYFKSVPKRSDPSQAETRRAKDFWTEVFQDVIVAQIDDSSVTRSAASELVRYAGEIADKALDQMEERWGKA